MITRLFRVAERHQNRAQGQDDERRLPVGLDRLCIRHVGSPLWVSGFSSSSCRRGEADSTMIRPGGSPEQPEPFGEPKRKGSVWSNAPVRSVKSERGHALSGAPEVRTGWSSRRSSIPSQAAAATGESCRLRAVGQSRTADGPAASGRGAPLHIPRCKRRCRLRLKPPDPASFA